MEIIDRRGEAWQPGDLVVFLGFNGNWTVGRFIPTPDSDLSRRLVWIREDFYVARNIDYCWHMTKSEIMMWKLTN